MLFQKLFLVSLLLCAANASSKRKTKKPKPQPQKDNLGNQSGLSDTPNTSTTPTPPPTFQATSALSFQYAELNKDYMNAVEAISKTAKSESGTKGLTFCNHKGCPDLPLDELVANHSIIISDAQKLREIFSILINVVYDALNAMPESLLDMRDAKDSEIANSITKEELEKKENSKAFFFNIKLRELMISKFKACCLTPERFLSLDFAAMPDLSLENANDYAEFLRLFMNQGKRSVFLPAVYMLNAVLQLESMMHELLLSGHQLADLEHLLSARDYLLKLSWKKAHYEPVCNILYSCFPMNIRKAQNNGKPPYSVNVTHALEAVDAIVSQGAIPELRAYHYAKAMSAFLLTDEAIKV